MSQEPKYTPKFIKLVAIAVGVPFLIWGYAEVVYYYYISPITIALGFVFVAAWVMYIVWLLWINYTIENSSKE